MEELLAQSSLASLNEGSIIVGRITEVRTTEVIIDIGGKSAPEIALSIVAQLVSERNKTIKI